MAALLGVTAMLGSCSGEEAVQDGKKTETGTETDKNLTTFVADAPGSDGTRTSMNASGVFKWEAGDKIWVKDDDGTWRQSSNSPTSSTDNFKFKVPGKFSASNTYTVYYPGKNGNQDKVTISAAQSQADPNDPAHVGISGDCGWATATAATGTKRFNFTLDHKTAFLVFSPYTTNTILQNSAVKLTKIEVTSDNNLVGTYTLDPVTNQLTGAGSGKQINLTTKGAGGSATEKGFSIPTSATPATNASYVVIKPGTHILKVRFWLKDYATGTEGTVTKLYPSFVYAANTYYTMPSELNINYPGNNYYMWDAAQQYWSGHEWDKTGYTAGTDQPTIGGQTGSAYPKSQVADPSRWYNTSFPGSGIRNDATQPHFASLPNANELSWYVMKGDPRRDGGELWTTMGHLYRGGMWFKKAATIAAENGITTAYMKEKTVNKIHDLRTTFIYFNKIPTNIAFNPISASDQSNYFFLPALGCSASGELRELGYGFYWSSSADPRGNNHNAYYLGYNNVDVHVNCYSRAYGSIVRAFE